MRRKGKAVRIEGRKTTGLKRLETGEYQIQFEGLPYSDVFVALTPAKAADFRDEYVIKQKAHGAHKDLRVMSLLQDWFVNYGRDGTALTYWSSLQGGGDKPGNRTDRPPNPGGFVDTFGERDLSKITAVEYAEFFGRATTAKGKRLTPKGRSKVRDAVKVLYWQANLSATPEGKLDHAILYSRVVKDAIGEDSQVRTAVLGMAPAMADEELVQVAEGGDTKALSVEELRRILRHAQDRPEPLWYMLLTQLVFGMRVGELRGLEKSDVNLDLRILQIRGSISANKMGGTPTARPLKEFSVKSAAAGKPQRPKIKFIPTRMLPILRTALDGLPGYRRTQAAGAASPRLFPGEAGGLAYTDAAGYARRVTETLRSAGIARVSSTHWMRHTRITRGTAIGDFREQDPDLLSAIGGHSSNAVQRYIHQDAVRMAHEAGQANEFLNELLAPRVVPSPPATATSQTGQLRTISRTDH